MDGAFTVAIERDWVVEMSRASANADRSVMDGQVKSPSIANASVESSMISKFPVYLAEMNVTMKQIDLSCKVIGPALAGLLLPLASSPSPTRGLMRGCILVGILNTLALIVEYICTAKIFAIIPGLALKKAVLHQNKQCGGDGAGVPWYHSYVGRELHVYLQQPIALTGVSLSLLYCNG